MAMQDNFGNPRGLLGRMMLSGMNLGHTSMAEWGLSQLVLPQKGNAADIGCGGGYNVRRLLRRIREGRVHGVDISPVSVKKSEAVNKKDLGRRCEIHQGSADALPFPDGSLDLVTAFETVYFWKNLPVCFREVKRVLKPGGQFAVINDPATRKSTGRIWWPAWWSTPRRTSPPRWKPRASPTSASPPGSTPTV